MAEIAKEITSVHKAIRILRVITQSSTKMGISELSVRMGMAKSTVARLLEILVDEKLLIKNNKTKKYHLSLLAFEMGSVVYNDIMVCQVSFPILQKFVSRNNVVAKLVLYDKEGSVVLLKLPLDHNSRIFSSMGKRLPYNATAPGKVMLAFQDDDEIERVIQNGLKSHTKTTISNPDQLKKELAKIRKDGYAISDEEYREGFNSIAVPIYDFRSQVIAAISIVFSKDLLPSSKVKHIINEMIISSQLISEQLELSLMRKFK
jgi:IclR family KDG regulon transcriptional repressor